MSQPLYGITHSPETGQALVRVPRVLKIGIGIPKGVGVHPFINWDEQRKNAFWYFRCYGAKQNERPTWFTSAQKVPYTEGSRVEAEKVFRSLLEKATPAKFPSKLPYFTFTRPVLHDKAEVFEPDFEAIEKHGPTPTAIDIVLMDDEPLQAEYAMWSASELQCHGDGLKAMRAISLADKETAKEYAGQRYFPVTQCACTGCEYFQEKDGKPAPCKPSGDLRFHLMNDIRIGTSAYFHTSGYRSIAWFFSSLEDLKMLTGGRLRGVPVRMSLRPYKTKHNGQVAVQFGVWLEFRAENIAALRKNLIQHALEFQRLAAPTPVIAPATKQIAAPVDVTGADEEPEEIITAQAMTDEFYPEAADEGDEPAAPEEPLAKAATEAKTDDLKEKLKSERKQSAAEKGDLF